jgi:hypothetical protein
VAQTVYSSRFVKSALTATNTTYYTVPAGYVAVVRTMTLAWASLARTAGVGQVLLNGANSYVWIVPIAGSELSSAVWDGRLVLPAAEIIRAATTATGVVFLTVSGYLLAVP